jgi:hypothetical protein
MRITQEIITEFEARVSRAEGRAARLAAPTKFYQKSSSLLPVYRQLVAARDADLTWAEVRTTVAAIPLEKQRKYSEALKYLQKTLQGHGSKMFATLRQYSTKVSKSQQRYMLPMLSADDEVPEAHATAAEGGVCLNLAMLWLKEQFDRTPGVLYPRLDAGNVMASESAYAVTKQAAGLAKSASTAIGLGLNMVNRSAVWSLLSFRGCPEHFQTRPKLKAILISFFGERHAVALFREPAGSFLFFDANAGSYSVPSATLGAFLTEYNDVCLHWKWPGYADPVTQPFGGVWEISKL